MPVRNDLSNLEKQIQWCQDNDDQCAVIAASGQALALEVVQEMDNDLCSAAIRLTQ